MKTIDSDRKEKNTYNNPSNVVIASTRTKNMKYLFIIIMINGIYIKFYLTV